MLKFIILTILFGVLPILYFFYPSPYGHLKYRLINKWTIANNKKFDYPFAICVDHRNGNVIVTDAKNHRVVVLNPEGQFIREIGDTGTRKGTLQKPTGVAVDKRGFIYVADYDRDKIIKFNEQGQFIMEWGETGEGNTYFQSPNGLALDEDSNVYVSDFYNKVIKVFDNKGQFIKIIGQSNQVGEKLEYPTDLDISPDRIFVADAYNHSIAYFDLKGKLIKRQRRVLSWDDAKKKKQAESLHVPTGVEFDSNYQILHIADSGNHRLVMLDLEGQTLDTYTLQNISLIDSPTMIAVSPNGKTVYATDTANNQVLVFTLE